jgi:hypothetical protein
LAIDLHPVLLQFKVWNTDETFARGISRTPVLFLYPISGRTGVEARIVLRTEGISSNRSTFFATRPKSVSLPDRQQAKDLSVSRNYRSLTSQRLGPTASSVGYLSWSGKRLRIAIDGVTVLPLPSAIASILAGKLGSNGVT